MSAGSCFVTGTDTGVGKTLVASALLLGHARRGRRAVGFKPVAAGMERRDGQWVQEDVERLAAASSVAVRPEQISPCMLRTPIAPHIAAAVEGVRIDAGRIAAAFESLRRRADVVVAEGAGGFRVPLDEGYDTADLARALGLPVVLVVGLRLGCINHALLTAEAVAARGMRLAGWVACSITPGMPHEAANIQALVRRLPGPLWGHVPWLAHPTAAAALPHLDEALF
ncbi:dethiobiotin synthase [Ramlibacter sp. AW1]|uniref:ATP-dependent dethiobiotin synthetase BioD n=1 Tax=Ramlibacter aurantiacus TaxID=2801330 RepID=A0A937D4W8_9BURK|nr:dethiobiotin synthase [Ramlibacter aurantiacus]MBL0420742.1 dethiobiotin synthase [Ramlibacter aurantiacus]